MAMSGSLHPGDAGAGTRCGGEDRLRPLLASWGMSQKQWTRSGKTYRERMASGENDAQGQQVPVAVQPRLCSGAAARRVRRTDAPGAQGGTRVGDPRGATPSVTLRLLARVRLEVLGSGRCRLGDAAIFFFFCAFGSVRYCSRYGVVLADASSTAETGRNHHRVGFGMVGEFSGPFPGYNATIPRDCATFPRILQENGYLTGGFGKWHLTPDNQQGFSGPLRDRLAARG